MHAILLVATFFTVWTALAIWTVQKGRGNGVPFDVERTLRLLAVRNPDAHRVEPRRTETRS